MSNLTDFLLARIAEDETEARTASKRQNKRANRLGLYGDRASGEVVVSPARVLAECEAKRWIVEMAVEYVTRDVETEILRALALPYADHPDYRDEWKREAANL